MKIWLVDYTTYKVKIDDRLQSYKRDYFKIKAYHRHNVIGDTAPVKSKTFSTGLLRIATLLRRNGYDVKYLHYDMVEKLLDLSETVPEIVAFSCVCPTVSRSARLAKKIKEKSPATEVVAGGVHINLAADETKRRYPIFDRLIVGYEKEAAEQIVRANIKEGKGGYVDYELLPLPLSEYAINTFTGTGCPFKCRYCVDGRAPRFCSGDNGQLDYMTKVLPEKTLVHFFDSVLGYSKEGISRVCKAIKETGHKFLLSCDMRAELLTPETIKAMQDAGFVEIRLGVESSSDKLLKVNGRTLPFERLENTLSMVREYSNLYIALYSITGLPETTWEIQENTLKEFDRLFKEKKVDEIKNALYVPYPVEGVDYSKQGITLLRDDWEYFDRQSFPVYRTEQLTSEELWEMYLKTAESINNSWLNGLGFDDIGQVPVVSGYYTEYIESSYLDEE